MKKIMLLSLMGIVFTGTAFAGPSNCLPKECSKRGTACLGSVNFVVDPGKNDADYMASYICRRDECGAGAVVFAPDLTKAFMCRIKREGREEGRWIDYNPKIANCSTEHMRMLRDRDVHGKWLLKEPVTDLYAKKTIVNSTWVDEHARHDTSRALVFGSENVCYAWTCEYGFVPDADGLKCIEGVEPEKLEPANQKCTGANEFNAPEEIDLTTVCKDCSHIKQGDCVDKDMFACYKAMKYKTSADKWDVVWNDYNACICSPSSKYEWNKDSGSCVEKQPVNFCVQLEQQGASAERLACCRAGAATTWNGDLKSGTCTCKDTNTEWNGSKCVKKVPDNSGDANCVWKTVGYVSCPNGREIISGTSITISADDLKKSGMDCIQFASKYANNLEYIRNQYCNNSQYSSPVKLDETTKKAIENMNAFLESARENATVWRNEEGKFNTARLASDATAGVVLGTVGGVVSAKVIKKKQLEKGYDVLNCTIGGQKMAGWGDVFNVGLRK